MRTGVEVVCELQTAVPVKWDDYVDILISFDIVSFSFYFTYCVGLCSGCNKIESMNCLRIII